MTAMFQVVFMAIGLAVLTFVIAFLFKKWHRSILWAVALLLFIGTSIMLGLGLLKIHENGMVNHALSFLFMEQRRLIKPYSIIPLLKCP